MEKHRLRQAIAERLHTLSPTAAAAESRSVCRRLIEMLPAEEHPICAYMPMLGEVDVRPVLDTVLQRNWPLYLPRFEHQQLVFRKAYDLSALTAGPFSVLEPPVDSPLLPQEAAPFVIVPGRAFDAHGNRLGRGNGGYDHWIAAQHNAGRTMQLIGVCFECQIVPNIPTEPHDQPLNVVVTARGMVG